VTLELGPWESAAVEDLRLSWRWVAIASLLVNLGAIATVAVVAGVKGAGALETVALALAIIAFICQLIIFSVQTAQSSQQLSQARDLNSATESLLSEARARIESTNQMVATQYQELLHLSALKSASEVVKESAERGEGGLDPQLLESMVARVLEQRPPAEEETPRPSPKPRARKVRRRSDPWDVEVLYGEAMNWGERKEVEEDLALFESFSNANITAFVLDVSDDVDSRFGGSTPGLHLTSIDEPLLEAGLVEETTPFASTEGAERRIVLTDRGRRAARLFVAPWPPPPREFAEITDRIWALRQRVDPLLRKTLSRVAAQLAPVGAPGRPNHTEQPDR
jgi:hypothetical protein